MECFFNGGDVFENISKALTSECDGIYIDIESDQEDSWICKSDNIPMSIPLSMSNDIKYLIRIEKFSDNNLSMFLKENVFVMTEDQKILRYVSFTEPSIQLGLIEKRKSYIVIETDKDDIAFVVLNLQSLSFDKVSTIKQKYSHIKIYVRDIVTKIHVNQCISYGVDGILSHKAHELKPYIDKHFKIENMCRISELE